MEHIKQNDSLLLPEIQKIGCFFRSCGLIAEYRTGNYLTHKQLNDGWKWAKSKGYINGNDDVINSAQIATYFLRELKDSGRFVEIGVFSNGKKTIYSGVKNTSYEHIDALIQKIKQNGPSKYHFRVVDKYGELIEDPHAPAITARGIFYSILYAYVEGKK